MGDCGEVAGERLCRYQRAQVLSTDNCDKNTRRYLSKMRSRLKSTDSNIDAMFRRVPGFFGTGKN